ncbi:MAG: VOC family protein [Gammaproteobacteria bacterium]|nr:VOC family protein [Gammaproteobacteria bacterium]
MNNQTNPVGWFEIPVNNLPRAKSFYEQVLGVTLEDNRMGNQEMAWFPMQQAGYGAAGGLIKSAKHEPSKRGTLVYLSVDDIDATLIRVETHGGEMLMPKTSIGKRSYIAHFADCEGNRVALHSQE